MNKLSFSSLVKSFQINKNDINLIFEKARFYEKSILNKTDFGEPLKNKLIATLFFEPSTRTKLSFESAVLRLGGKNISINDINSSSIFKGESIKDTAKIVDAYADMIIFRDKSEDISDIFLKNCKAPIINAGNGANQHPTQALIDLYTIEKEKGRLDNLIITIVGDLKYSRAINSFINLISLYPGNKLKLISSVNLEINDNLRKFLRENSVDYVEDRRVEDHVIDSDVLYVTRVQKERFASQEERNKIKSDFIVDKKLINLAQNDLIILHPLPRIDELDEEVDDMPQAKYFNQAKNGLYVRMALLDLMFNR